MLTSTGVHVTPVVLTNHFCTALDPAGRDPSVTMGRRSPKPGDLAKVTFRWRCDAVIHQGNHGVTLPDRSGGATGLVEVWHFPYRSAKQLVSMRSTARLRTA
ncbi:hypothetical protein O7635_24405 [Asanoa sp. WMMD1127]|uniref:hypothetical protein n=1 Tax=Asanoa sp. WMMD1127 TaxID=3016107 RepID=UPI00241690C6|nr:hypothetical protein [Asanoa sp. WMMD1127]MDG4825003.1 hypothetical protein [Asanoa sp. WMMD1127]